MSVDWHDLPGAELIEKGLHDLESGGEPTPESLLLEIAQTRLRRAGLQVPKLPWCPEAAELRLYRLLGASRVPDPYSTYNSLLRRLTSFAAGLERRAKLGIA